MVTVIAGPSGAGKSTLIERRNLTPIIYAHQLSSVDVPSVGFLHYNMLHYALSFPVDWTNLSHEPLLSKVLNSGIIKKVLVIVAPIAELKNRAEMRSFIEPTQKDTGKYNNKLWLKIYKSIDLFSVYAHFFELLDTFHIDFEVLYSSEVMPSFLPSDRCYVHHNLRGIYISPPRCEHVDNVIDLKGAEYQSVQLPLGKETKSHGYSHLHGSRNATFDLIRTANLQNRSVLDIGCALGDFLFRFEQCGACRLLGLEPMARRYKAAKAIRDLLFSKIELFPTDLEKAQLEDEFDDVLALNVIHHVSDIFIFVRKAVTYAKKRLIIEYPTLNDEKFLNLHGETNLTALKASSLPIIGLSSKVIDQTFVFTRGAIISLVTDTADFDFKFIDSPIPNREIAICERRFVKET